MWINRCSTIQRRDTFVRVRPVPRPVAVDPEVAGIAPTTRTISVVHETVFEFADLAAVSIVLSVVGWKTGNECPVTFVRPASNGHRSSIEEQFTVSRDRRTSKASRKQLAVLSHARDRAD